jgi:hypothetical protein
MSLIARPRWTRQPQGAVEVDWSNPITKGLVVETGGHRYTGVRLIDGTVNQSTNTGANVSLAHTRYGKALSFNGSQANGAASFGDIIRGDDGYTQASWHILFKNDSSTAESKIFAKWGAIQGSWLISTNGSGTGIQAWVVAANSIDFTLFNASNVFEATGWNNAVFIWRGGTTTSDVSLFVNGVDKSSSLSLVVAGASAMINGDSNVQIGVGNDGGPMDGKVVVARMWKRGLSLNEALELSRNPWGILKPVTRTIGAVISGVTISRPSSDITTTGWTGDPDNVTLFNNIDEVTPSDTDFIISPALNATPGPAVFGITPTQASGTYNVRLRAKRTGSTGDIRALLLDSGGATVGTSSWQALTAAFAQYTLSVTTTGTAARVQLEVRQ